MVLRRTGRPAEDQAQPEAARLEEMPARAQRPGLLLAVGTALGVFLGIVAYAAFVPAPESLTAEDVELIAARQLASATPPPANSAEVYQIILPSLVVVQSQRDGGDPNHRNSIGTGVIVNIEGDILTARHVVAGAARIRVAFTDGSQVQAELLGERPELDIAVLRPARPPDLVVPAVLGSSAGIRVGDEAYAVGNPLGLVASISAGVISGLDRSYDLGDGQGRLEGLIQFDAAVNPGNSGGPLLNRYGQVIGIVTALANPSDQDFFIGIGFAVPISIAGGAAGAPDY